MQRVIIPVLLIIFGLVLLFYTWKPILEWKFLIKPGWTKKQTSFISPISNFQESLFAKKTNMVPVSAKSGDYQKEKVNPKEFFLTIDKLKIKKARVVTGDNFKTQLAHLPQTATPGEVGNAVIVGHSVLPQFFQSTNYLTIFSKLYLLEKGDKVFLEKEGENYTYEVLDLLVVKPTDTWILSPPEPSLSYLTLLTCGVGGLTSERIVIRAILQNSDLT